MKKVVANTTLARAVPTRNAFVRAAVHVAINPKQALSVGWRKLRFAKDQDVLSLLHVEMSGVVG
jgi:hypothetical protein